MTTRSRTIGAFAATLGEHRVGDDTVALWQVADLERHIDREALLAGENPPEPPYWAHLWSGARVLAEAVPRRAGRVLEVGCGLGLPGLVAARRGARVTFLDRTAVSLEFVRASAAANDVHDAAQVVADLTCPPFREPFDLVLAAEVLYERSQFPHVARALRTLTAPRGQVLLADGGRIDTRAFYPELEACGLSFRTEERRVDEEGFPVTVRLVVIERA